MLARNAIEKYLEDASVISPPEEEFLQNPGAAFVTLKFGKELRGCIGSTLFSDPLGITIVHCALSAAFHDPRFNPLSRDEYSRIRVEISVLSPFVRCLNPEELIVGLHGAMITNHRHRGLLLPQVATEYNWDRETFLTYACRKAGLSDQAWKEDTTCLEIFTAEVFGEND